MERVVLLSLIITGIHIAFAAGNFLSPIRVLISYWLDRAIGKKWSLYVQKPLWLCLPCMGSIWSIVLTWHFDLLLICAVCGLNVIISRLIEQDEAVELTEVKGFAVTEYSDEVPTISRQTLKHHQV